MKKSHYEKFPRKSAHKLDRIDVKILNVLQSNNQVTNLELAEMVGISPPACLRRVRNLREEGVIKGDVSLVDPFQIGNNLVVYVVVTLERHREDLFEAFERKVMAAPEVTQCYFISGVGDYLVSFVARDQQHYHDIVWRLFASEPNIQTFRSSVALRKVKYETKIHLVPDEL